MNTQQRKLLHLLYRTEYITATELAANLGISVKTARIRIKEMNPLLEQYGVQILSKPRYGYFLEPRESDKVEALFRDEKKAEQAIPSTSQERIHFLLAYLLNRTGYIKSDELCEFLYISKGTLTNALRQVEEVYKEYHLSLEKKPGYGIRVMGSEFDIRQCMVDIFVKNDGLDGIGRRHQTEEIETLGGIVYQCARKYGFELSELSYNDFVEHIYVALRRIRQEKYVEFQPPEFGARERQFMEELVCLVEEKYGVSFPQIEKDYLTLQLAGKIFIEGGLQESGNFVIKSEMDQLAGQMLDLIYREFHVDLRSDLELRMELNRYLIPLSIRLRYHILFRNPMLEEIKKNYVLSYTAASQLTQLLTEAFQSPLSEDEIAGLAEVLELALERQENEQKYAQRKFSILIVCASGKTSSQILKYKYEREFEHNIDRIYVCNLYELESFPFDKIDYVFTTVPISSHIPVPILEISSFLKENDIAAVRRLFEEESRDFLQQYYSRKLFFTDIEGTERDEILLEICRRVQKIKGLPEEFGESVLRRERLTPTDYGNLVAIPHPDQAFQERTFVAAAILKEPIFWSRQKVQVVILTAIGRSEDENIQKFYEVTTDLILRPEDVAELIKEKKFDTLLRLLRKSE